MKKEQENLIIELNKIISNGLIGLSQESVDYIRREKENYETKSVDRKREKI